MSAHVPSTNNCSRVCTDVYIYVHMLMLLAQGLGRMVGVLHLGLVGPLFTALVTCQACGETHNNGIDQLLEPRSHQANLDIHEISCASVGMDTSLATRSETSNSLLSA